MSQREKQPTSFGPSVFDDEEDESPQKPDCKATIDLAYKLGTVTSEMQILKRKYFYAVFIAVICFITAFSLGCFWFYQEVKKY